MTLRRMLLVLLLAVVAPVAAQTETETATPSPTPSAVPAYLGLMVDDDGVVGALVQSVAADSPLGDAVQPGDVLLQIDEAVVSVATLPDVLAGYGAGDSALLLLVRDGAAFTVEVTFAQRPLTAQQRLYLGVQASDAPEGGALVNDVLAGPALDAGVQPGDVITAFDGQPVTTAADLATLVEGAAPYTPLELTFTRDGGTQTVTLTLAVVDGLPTVPRPSPPMMGETLVPPGAEALEEGTAPSREDVFGN